MALDYAWSYDPVFPEAVFADPLVGAMLGAWGMGYEDRANLIPAFLHTPTVAAMLRLDDALRALLAGISISYAPHSLSQPGDALAQRAAWALDALRPLAQQWRAQGWDEATVSAMVAPIHATARDVVLRHGIHGPDGSVVPDMSRLAPFFVASPEPFSTPSALQVLIGHDPTPWPADAHTSADEQALEEARSTLTATALSFGLVGGLKAQIERFAPHVFTGARIVSDGGGASLVFAKGRATVSVVMHMRPLPSTTLMAAVARNALLPRDRPNLAHMAHIKATLRVPKGAAVAADEARLLLHTIAALEGPGTILDDAGVFVPKGWVERHLHPASGWPVAAMIGVERTSSPCATSLVAHGLTARVGYACALESTAAFPSPDPRALVAIAGWLLDTHPTVLDGHTIGCMGKAQYTATWQTSGAGRVLTFRPLDTMRPRWVLERIKAGRLRPLNEAIDPRNAWKPAWIRARIDQGRLAPLNAAIAQEVAPATVLPPPTFTVPNLP